VVSASRLRRQISRADTGKSTFFIAVGRVATDTDGTDHRAALILDQYTAWHRYEPPIDNDVGLRKLMEVMVYPRHAETVGALIASD